MKYTALRAFEKHLEGSIPNNFAPLYMILGKDSGERRIALDTLVLYLRRAQSQGELSVRSFQGDGMKATDLARELNTFSFFAPKEIIIVHDADTLKKDAIEWLTAYFPQTNPRQTLILSAASILQSTNYYKQAEKVGVVLDCVEEKAWEKEKMLAEWVAQVVAPQKKQISPSTCQSLVKHVGLDRTLLKSEIDKLMCFIGDRSEITPKDILTICTPGPTGNEWQLGEAIMRLDGANALKILHDLFKENASFFALIRQLRTQFQTGCNIASILNGGNGVEGVAKEFPYLKGRILDQKVQLTQNYGMERFRRGLILIDEAELSAKNGMDDHELLADMTIIKLTR